jgi:hypothetical protein
VKSIDEVEDERDDDDERDDGQHGEVSVGVSGGWQSQVISPFRWPAL